MTDRNPQSCWFRLTPDRVVALLLALEGFLWLSERSHWFSFNEHKCWTVLIGLAAIGAAFVAMLLWFLAAVVFRLRFQFSIRSLLMLMVVVAIPCSWLAEARKQREIVVEIEKAGGEVHYDFQLDPSFNGVSGAQATGTSLAAQMAGR